MNTLKHLTEFQDLLHDYQLPGEEQTKLKATRLTLLTAPTSVGRNTVIRELVKTGNYDYIVSDTTREPRINDGLLERNGVEYWFRSEDEVLEDLRHGKYLEAAIIHNQQVSGISLRELEKANAQGKIAITDVEIAGAEAVIRAKPDTKVVFMVPPGFSEWQRRLMHRGHMSQAEIHRRMASAAKEFAQALQRQYFVFVINDLVDGAARRIDEYVRLGKLDEAEQAKARTLIQQLSLETSKYLQ